MVRNLPVSGKFGAGKFIGGNFAVGSFTARHFRLGKICRVKFRRTTFSGYFDFCLHLTNPPRKWTPPKSLCKRFSDDFKQKKKFWYKKIWTWGRCWVWRIF